MLYKDFSALNTTAKLAELARTPYDLTRPDALTAARFKA